MANPYFSFKQFTVWQEHAAMRVGTDGVLLGAWCDLSLDEAQLRAQEHEEISRSGRVLDIGSGTGVIALMVAQRAPYMQIDAIEPDPGSCEDALRNFAESPWSDRLQLYRMTLQEYVADQAGKVQYDCIASNPPYFVDSLKAPDPARNAVRHAVSLPFEELLDGVRALLAETGRFAVILPVAEGGLLERLALVRGLHCVRKCLVQTKPDVPPKRIMMEFRRQWMPLQSDLLTMETDRQQEFTEAYRRLTGDFYLKF